MPDDMLLKPGKLTREEFEIVKTHTIEGARILSGSGSQLFGLAREVALYHHERLDGGGYLHLSGDKIPLAARIVALADVFDALTSARSYKAVWTVEQALDYIHKERDRAFDARVVEAFLRSRDATRHAVKVPHE